MTIRKSLLAAFGTVAVAAIWIPQASQAAVTITVPRPVISIPRVTIPAVKPAIPTVRPVVSAVKPAMPAVKQPISVSVATHATASVSSTHTPVTAPDPNSVPWANVGGTTTLDPNVAVPPHTGPAIAAVLNGKPVIKLTDVNGNETTVYYLSRDQKHIVAAISSTSTVPPQNVAATQPQQPSSSKPAASSGQKVTSTPVSYPEIKDAYGAPMGYVNAQGQNVYFPNGQMPIGFSVGPNNTIETYTKS
jgi:hypothetical protein